MSMAVGFGALLAPLINHSIQRWVVYPIQEWAIRQPRQQRWWLRLLLQGRASNLRAVHRVFGIDHLPR